MIHISNQTTRRLSTVNPVRLECAKRKVAWTCISESLASPFCAVPAPEFRRKDGKTPAATKESLRQHGYFRRILAEMNRVLQT
jgi:hypothetical protein